MICKGNKASEGLGIGEVFCYRPAELKVVQSYIAENEVSETLVQYEAFKSDVKNQLDSLIVQFQTVDPDQAKIFLAHREILHDDAIDEEIRNKIGKDLYDLAWAVETVYDGFSRLLSEMKNELFRERAQDVKDVRNRLLRSILGLKCSALSSLDKPVVIACHDLLPSDTATLDCHKVIAIITETGGETSHSAIIARSYGIPAILGIDGLMDKVQGGELVVVDAMEGELIIVPTEEQLKEYKEKQKQYLATVSSRNAYLDKLSVTKDGVRFEIGINIGSPNEVEVKQAPYADFVGLFRSEFLYMTSPGIPSEEDQFKAYKRVLETFKRPITLRTLDVGGDKSIPCLPLPKEDNPFLGQRGLRFCFEHKEFFETQVRAALRASYYGELHLMLPMVTNMDDIYKAKEIILALRDELLKEGVPMAPKTKLGIMVEIPSIALIADHVAKEVDFISIGTNDLCQYTLAVDRMNPNLSDYYQSFHPALFKLIAFCTEEFRKSGKPVSVCGELGGHPLAAVVLAGLGVRKFSMNPPSMGKVKRALTEITMDFAESLAQNVLSMATADEVINYLETELRGFTG